MKFKIEDIIVDDYQTAFEIIKDKIRPELSNINKHEMILVIKDYPFKNQFSTDGITIIIESIQKENLDSVQDNTTVATVTLTFPRGKIVKYEIIKNPSDKKVKKKWLFQTIT